MPYVKSKQKRIDAGLCKDCGSVRAPDGNKTMCRKCVVKNMERSRVPQKIKNAKLIHEWESGNKICTSCGGELHDKTFKTCKKCLTYAVNHRKKHKERRTKFKKENKICTNCSNEAMKKRCKKCWTRGILGSHKIDIDLWQDYWNMLVKQDFKCYYSGLELTPEVNASLDHVIPKSRGGANDMSNIVWCDLALNTFKWTNDYESLINLCRLLISNHEKREKQKNGPKTTE